MVKTINSKLQIYLSQSKVITGKKITNPKLIYPLSAAFLGAIGGLEAQIVYSGVQNVSCALAGNTNRCYANINNAGGNDFEFHRNHVGGMVFIQIDEVLGGGFDLNGFHAQLAAGYVYPYANAENVNVGPALPWNFQAGQANSLSDNGFYPNHKWEPLPNGTTGFIGIRGTIAGQTKYGWIRLTKNSFGNYTIVDWAYNNTTNGTILTGQTAASGSTAAVLSVDDPSICNGQSANLKVAITGGVSPYTVVYSDGMSNFTVNNYVSNANIPIMPSSTKTYSLISVTDSGNNPGTGNTGTPSVTVNNGSTSAVLSVDDNSICVGESANLKVLISGGTSPYSVIYSDGMSNFTVSGYVSNANIPVSPVSNKTYSLISVTDANSCVGAGNSGMPSISVTTYITIMPGSYNNPATWCGGIVPPEPIPMGTTVTIGHNVSNANIITNNGTILCTGGATLTNTGTIKGKGSINGTLINNGTISPGN